MFGLGWQELLLIFFIALLVFGPKKLPEVGRSIGRAIAEFKKSSEEFKEQLEKAVEEEKTVPDDISKEKPAEGEVVNGEEKKKKTE